MPDPSVRTDFPRRIREIENAWIPMPDGARLAARIWLPEDAEADPVPAILEYLPYRKRDGTAARDRLTHPYFAGHGYAGVRVDMRGTGDSDGVCLGEYLAQEQDDALAVIDWLAARPWCSGEVGMIGISWGGFNALQVAARRPEPLGAVVTLCSTDDRYADDIHFMGGAVLTDKLAWGATAFAVANAPPDPAVVGGRWREMWRARLEGNGLWMLDWFRRQRRDAFYRHGSICEDYGAVQVPVYAVGGYADGYTNPIFRMMERLECPRKALIGPWAHKYPHFAAPGPRIGFLQECLRWWDEHLKGVDTGIMDEPMIRAWMQEAAPPDPAPAERPGRWISEPAWPPEPARALSLYVAPEGLGEAARDAGVAIDCPETAGRAAPAWCAYGAGADGALDQNAEAGLMRFFETAPLASDMEILGFPRLRMRVASDVPQANVAAVLSLVAPDGRASFVSFGVLNLAHRDSHADPSPLPVGEPVEASLQLNAVGQRLPAGCRLRLALSQAYWPLVWPSPRKARLALERARLDLPLRPVPEEEAPLAEFGPPEGAEPLEVEILEPGGDSRTLTLDRATGAETHERFEDSGLVTHLRAGLTLRSVSRETFRIHPGDPNSAVGACRWEKSYARGSWRAELEAEARVAALAGAWRVTARLAARDGEGVVAEREWAEDIPRDLA